MKNRRLKMGFVAMMVVFICLGVAFGAVTYQFVLSAPKTTHVTTHPTPTPTPTPVSIPVTLQAPANAYDNEQITLTATIQDANGNGKTVNFYKDGVNVGHATFVSLTASVTIGPLPVGDYVFTAGP